MREVSETRNRLNKRNLLDMHRKERQRNESNEIIFEKPFLNFSKWLNSRSHKMLKQASVNIKHVAHQTNYSEAEVLTSLGLGGLGAGAFIGIISGCLKRELCTMVTLVYPLYQTFQALEETRVHDFLIERELHWTHKRNNVVEQPPSEAVAEETKINKKYAKDLVSVSKTRQTAWLQFWVLYATFTSIQNLLEICLGRRGRNLLLSMKLSLFFCLLNLHWNPSLCFGIDSESIMRCSLHRVSTLYFLILRPLLKKAFTTVETEFMRTQAILVALSHEFFSKALQNALG